MGSHDDPRRRLPRHKTDVVSCPLGDLLDLSGTGMRVGVKGRCVIKVGQAVPLKLQTPSGSVRVRARAVWRRRTGLFGNYELGFNFEGITHAQTVALATIARFGFITSDNVKTAQSSMDERAGRSAKQRGPKACVTPPVVEASILLREYYERLGLKDGASAADVKQAYHQLARQYHPDMAPGDENKKRFLEIREAYDLIDDHLRHAG